MKRLLLTSFCIASMAVFWALLILSFFIPENFHVF